MPELHLSISFRFVLLLFAVFCSFMFPRLCTAGTVPPISPVKRYILISLRCFGLFLLFLLLGEPLLSSHNSFC